jgi:hypothetical protein
MSSSDQSPSQPPQNHFDRANVSIGFVWSLQDSVLRLEQNQQHLITQLDHANAISAEFYEKSVLYHRKYDEALREMEEQRRKHEMDTQLLSQKIEHSKQDTQTERAIRQIHEEQIRLLERQIAHQVTYAAISQATTIHENEDSTYDLDREILSPVSVASPSPRAAHHGQQSPRLEPETPNSDTHDNDTEDEHDDAYNAYYDERNRSPQSSDTTDCSGDPIYPSDTDSDGAMR